MHKYQALRQYRNEGAQVLAPALIVKSAVRRTQVDAVAAFLSGHLLRVGYCTQAAIAGLAAWQICETTAHRFDATLSKYIRPVQ